MAKHLLWLAVGVAVLAGCATNKYPMRHCPLYDDGLLEASTYCTREPCPVHEWVPAHFNHGEEECTDPKCENIVFIQSLKDGVLTP